MTEEQLGGTASQQEASASETEQSTQQSVGAVAVADEPATPVDRAPTGDTPADEATDTSASDRGPESRTGAGSTRAREGSAREEAPGGDGADLSVSQDELADAPAASDDTASDEAAANGEPAALPQRAEPQTMAELLAEQDADIKSFKHGDVVEGQVVRIDKDEILVDIGAKSEGVVSNRELYGRHAETQPQLAIGDTVLVYVLQPESQEGHVVLSLRRAGLERKWRAMQEQFEAGAIIEAPVIDHNKGGLIVDCGIRGFVPISQIVDFPRRPQNDQPRDAAQEIAEKLQPFVGRKLRLKILEVNRKANRLILSEKVALYEERREKRDELFSSLQVGQKVKGTVRSIAPFGVFVDLGGIDGLVHKSELSWNKVNNPESGYRVGEEVEAEVIDINHERGRISLSIRRLQPDPWHSTVADFKIGDVIDGTVTKLVNFGAFVRVRDGLEGLIHISELSHQRVAHPGDVVHEGQDLKLKIISLDSERHRLGLSLKQAEEPPARPAPPEPAAPAAPRAEREPRAERGERRPRQERGYSLADAVQEPEGGIDNTLASAFAQVRQQMAASEAARVDEAVEAVEDDIPGDSTTTPVTTAADVDEPMDQGTEAAAKGALNVGPDRTMDAISNTEEPAPVAAEAAAEAEVVAEAAHPRRGAGKTKAEAEAEPRAKSPRVAAKSRTAPEASTDAGEAAPAAAERPTAEATAPSDEGDEATA